MVDSSISESVSRVFRCSSEKLLQPCITHLTLVGLRFSCPEGINLPCLRPSAPLGPVQTCAHACAVCDVFMPALLNALHCCHLQVFNMLESCVAEVAAAGYDRPPSGSTISGGASLPNLQALAACMLEHVLTCQER